MKRRFCWTSRLAVPAPPSFLSLLHPNRHLKADLRNALSRYTDRLIHVPYAEPSHSLRTIQTLLTLSSVGPPTKYRCIHNGPIPPPLPPYEHLGHFQLLFWWMRILRQTTVCKSVRFCCFSKEQACAMNPSGEKGCIHLASCDGLPPTALA